MPVFTIQTLVDRAASIADMHDQFVKPTEWLSWYNTERRALQLFMVRSGDVAQNVTFASLNGSDVLTIATETIAIAGVWEVLSTGNLRPLKIVPFVDNYFQLEGFGTATGRAQFATLRDSNGVASSNTFLQLYPRDMTGNYLIAVVNAPLVATALSDTTSLPMGLEERIVLGMARRALIKEESDVTDISRLIKEQDQFTEEFIWSRALNQVPSVRNVDGLQRGWGSSEWAIPHADTWAWV